MAPLASVSHHLGTLHAYETVLVLVIAFGPFVVIAGLVARERRRAAARERIDSTGHRGAGRSGGVGRESRD